MNRKLTYPELSPGDGERPHVHGLFTGLRVNAVEHDVGEHVGQEQHQAAGHTLHGAEW